MVKAQKVKNSCLAVDLEGKELANSTTLRNLVSIERGDRILTSFYGDEYN